MEQIIGQNLERLLEEPTYLHILPRDLRQLLYKYVYLKSQSKIKVIPDDNIDPFIRVYDREIRLEIKNFASRSVYSFDINYMKTHDVHIDHFINKLLKVEPYNNILPINEYIEFDLNTEFYNLSIFTTVTDLTKPSHSRERFRIIASTTLELKADILDALLRIADLENLH